MTWQYIVFLFDLILFTRWGLTVIIVHKCDWARGSSGLYLHIQVQSNPSMLMRQDSRTICVTSPLFGPWRTFSIRKLLNCRKIFMHNINSSTSVFYFECFCSKDFKKWSEESSKVLPQFVDQQEEDGIDHLLAGWNFLWQANSHSVIR